jgi:membrane-bound hydrogenase subunit mbhJ
MGIEERVIRLFHINVGSCNGCDIEVYSLTESGYEFVDDHTADVIVVCGSVNSQTRPILTQLLGKAQKIPIVAVGTCAISARVFSDKGVKPVDEFTHIDMYVFGCPPRPQEIKNGILRVLKP